jgi:hypothetical protein
MEQLKFGFAGVESAVNTFKDRIEPGVHEVKILGVTIEENKNGKKYIAIKCESLDGSAEHEEKMYISTDKGMEATTSRIKHLLEVVVQKPIETEVTVESISKSLKNKEVRIKFTGEEFLNSKGDVAVAASFAFKSFAEHMSVNPSKLKYNPSNSYDYKKLEVPDTSKGYTSVTADEDDSDVF